VAKHYSSHRNSRRRLRLIADVTDSSKRPMTADTHHARLRARRRINRGPFEDESCMLRSSGTFFQTCRKRLSRTVTGFICRMAGDSHRANGTAWYVRIVALFGSTSGHACSIARFC
jgi:hypothetical protein